MIRLPNTVPIPAPDPATPTVAAPAPMNFAAVSMSRETALVWKERDRTTDWLRGSKAWRGVGGQEENSELHVQQHMFLCLKQHFVEQ